MRSQDKQQQSKEGKRTIVLREAKAYIQCQQLPKFAWGQRWLKGNEYALMLRNMNEYCQKYSIERYGFNQHPIHIYTQPQNGIIYFLQGSNLEHLGYPRIQAKKKYCWKKMNFPTYLPKADPQVKYLVASSFVSGEIQQEGSGVYRMHIVAPTKFQSEYLLCHIRRVGVQEGEVEVNEQQKQLKECFVGQINFYRLFMFLHNHYHSK